MRANDGRIDHQPFKVGFARQHRKHVVQHAHLDPANGMDGSPSTIQAESLQQEGELQ